MDMEETDENVINVNIPLVTRIIYGIWLVICLIPNSILIKKLSKHEYYQINFYYIIVHWSWSNILQMIFSIYVTFVPQELASNEVSVFSTIFYLLTQLPAQLAFFFTIDKFVNSKKFCRDNTRMGYKSLGCAVIFLSILAKYDMAHVYTLAIGFVAIMGLTCLAFVMSLIIHCIIGSEEDNYCLRIIMSSICVVINSLYIVYVVLVVFLEFNLYEIYFYVTMVVHLNGMANILLLHFNDPSINIQSMISKKLEKQKRKCLNFRNKFRSNNTTSEQEASQTMSRNEDSIV